MNLYYSQLHCPSFAQREQKIRLQCLSICMPLRVCLNSIVIVRFARLPVIYLCLVTVGNSTFYLNDTKVR